MARGENIFKRKDGRWEARYIKGYELSGKIKYGFCYGKTYKEAKEKATKCRAALMNGTPLSGSLQRRRLSFYCEEWLKTNKNRFKESTYIKYEGILKKHIMPKLGECCPAAITTEMISAFSDDMLYQEGLSAKTVKDILAVLHAVLKYSSQKFAGIMVNAEIIYPRMDRQEIRVLSKEEQNRLVAYLLQDMDSCRFGILLALFTGIRLGELCALRWENISLAEKTLKVNGTMQRLKDLEEGAASKTKIVIGTPKSGKSIRLIPLNDSVAALCEKVRPQNDAAFVLTSTETYMEPRTVQYRLQKYAKACGVEDVHFHTLRHTFATRCVEVGFEIKSLSDILGHSTTTITLERYVHSSIELKRDNMKKLTAVDM